MAVTAVKDAVVSFQFEICPDSMIPLVEGDIFPCMGSMTLCAVNAKPELIAVILAAFPVTDFTVFWSSLKNQIRMTFTAGNGAVFSYKWKICVVMGLDGPPGYLLLLSQIEPQKKAAKDVHC